MEAGTGFEPVSQGFRVPCRTLGLTGSEWSAGEDLNLRTRSGDDLQSPCFSLLHTYRKLKTSGGNHPPSFLAQELVPAGYSGVR